jgi:hypothetical protein
LQKTEKILIISYYWPPAGGSGVQRWMYFSKYLSQFNFQPIILSIDEYDAYVGLTDKIIGWKLNCERYLEKYIHL